MNKAAVDQLRSESRAPPRIGSLLVSVDLTPLSDRVLGRVSLLPLADDAKVTLLHVVSASLQPAEQRRAEREARTALDDEARYLRKTLPKHARVELVVSTGSAAREISACATRVEAELIVMGRGGEQTLRDSVLGSTAERVIRRTRLPVLAVRLLARAAYRRPALALDFDQAAYEAVRLMLLVLPPPRPLVRVVHAFDLPYPGAAFSSISEDELDARKEELQTTATQELTKLVAKALAKGNASGRHAPDWEAHVHYGSPRMVVEKAATRARADLLVLGTRGHAGAAWVFLGTVAGDVLRRTKCDVLVVPPVARKGTSASLLD